jgi:ubiquinone/menaquinone biosynthesis C-methylase UbiE
MEQVEKHYNNLAKVYEKRWRNYLVNTSKEIIKNLNLKSNLKILDVACGTGFLIKKLLETNSKIEITGIDISKEMIAIAKKRFENNKNVTLIKANAEKFEVKDKFNIIIFNSAMHYIKDIEDLIVKLRQLLSSNGYLIIVDWSKDPLLFKLLNLYWKFRIKAFKGIYNQNKIKKILTKNSFNVIQSYTFNATKFWKLYLIKAKL